MTRPASQHMSLADLEGRSGGPGGPFVTGSQAWMQRIAMLPLDALDAEDLLVLLGRQRGVRHLLPHALAKLEEQPFDAGAHRPGELLLVVCALPDDCLDDVPASRERLAGIVQGALRRIDEVPGRERARVREELEVAHDRFRVVRAE